MEAGAAWGRAGVALANAAAAGELAAEGTEAVMEAAVASEPADGPLASGAVGAA